MPGFDLKVTASPDSEDEDGIQKSEGRLREWESDGPIGGT